MKIVVPIGDENLSFRALEFALKIVKSTGNEGKIIVVHSLFGGNKTSVEDIRRAEHLLNRAVEIVQKEGVNVEKRLLIRGKSPGEDIVGIAEEINADMIAMGCGLLRFQQEVLLGSVTKYVLIHSKRPILLVK